MLHVAIPVLAGLALFLTAKRGSTGEPAPPNLVARPVDGGKVEVYDGDTFILTFDAGRKVVTFSATAPDTVIDYAVNFYGLHTKQVDPVQGTV